ncbi:MAG: YtxH domain-containing protein [Vicinamibacterales bacterium]
MGQDNGGGAVLAAFVLGAVAGAAVALLWAPASGEETRRLLKERAGEARDKANEAARQGRDYLDRQRDNLSTAFERGKEAYHRAHTEEQA